ncbi:MAG: hypothetical protein K9J37_00655 [Saprospiraceae bacterium]|nr:hypothetical protein [Saprospiraceae bacterium]MCF8248384.1 hypothetical protein [Saprospiraceae bacterium]MCF8280055.1 hypothetical protein [Bacteroidales bacterium]MCF8309912.1 hypothetical protein [Saprospiraceae bacterium]MCF8438757.1 hypothetical protein [Saprospiraceae bacterium]
MNLINADFQQRCWLPLFIFLLSFCHPTQAQIKSEPSPKNRIWGYSFGDVIYKAQGDTLYWGNTEYAGLEEKTIGTNLRRLFLGYDSKITENIKARVLVESKATTTTKEGRFGLALIYGHLEWNDIVPAIPNSTVRIGLIPTPIFALPEKSWGYRSVEKNALDLRGIGKVIDQGASFSGDFNDDKTAGFTVMVGNGTGNKPGIDKYLEYYASFYRKLWDNQVTVEILGDFMKENEVTDHAFIRGFLSVEKPLWTFGTEVSQVYSKELVSGYSQHVNPRLVSVFFSNKLGFIGEKWRSFLRYDFYDPSTKYHPGGIYTDPSQHYIEHSFWFGLHYGYKDKINIMPNTILNHYKRKNNTVVKRISDIVPRITVYFQFGD